MGDEQMLTRILRFSLFTIIATGCAGAAAAPATWTDWTGAGTSVVSGTLDVGGTPVTVTYSGPYSGAQTTCGTNYWTHPETYQSSVVDNAPPGCDIIQLSGGGEKTITFSESVQDPLIALVSWNGNVVDFGVPIEILSYGQGYWGNGTPILNSGGTGFTGSGEVHGTIRLPGYYTQISFTDTSEGWHGFTVGVLGLGDENQVPEPPTLLLVMLFLIGLGSMRRFKS